MLDPPLDSQIMTEEIFGPVLPIITVRINNPILCFQFSHILCHYLIQHLNMASGQINKIQGSIEFINERPKPLAIYAFTKDETFKRKILSETSSGSVIFNDTLVQVLLLSSSSSLPKFSFLYKKRKYNVEKSSNSLILCAVFM